jgi:hypothetical protein
MNSNSMHSTGAKKRYSNCISDNVCRLQLLRGIENIKSRGFDGPEYTTKLNMVNQMSLHLSDILIAMMQLESKYMPLRTRDQLEIDGTGRTSDQRKDNISHFILRLAYCRTEELRRCVFTHTLPLHNIPSTCSFHIMQMVLGPGVSLVEAPSRQAYGRGEGKFHAQQWP